MTASPLEGEQRPQQGFFKDPLEEFFTFSDDDTETNSVGLGHDRKGPSLSVKAGVASRESLSSVPVSPAIPILTVSQVTDDFFDTAATSVVPGTPLADLGLGSLSMHSPSAVSVSSLSQVASTVSPSALGLNLGATSTSFLSPSLAIVPPPTKNGFLCAPGGAAQGLSTNPVARSPLTGMQQQFDDFTIGGDVSESGYFSPSVAVSEGYLSPAVAISEGYFSPSVALAEGWTPEILCIPSPLIHAIPSPMPYFSNGFNQSPLMSASPQLRLALENQHLAQQMRMHQGQQQQTFPHSTPETMQKFWASNSGLGLNNPNKLDIQTLSHDPELQVSFESMLVSLGLAPEEVQDNPSQGTGQQSQQPQQSSFSALGLVQPSVPSTVSRSAFPKPPAYPRPVQASSSTETLVDKAESQPTSVCASPSVPLSGGERRKPFWNLVKSDGRTLYQCPYQDCGKTFTRPYNLKSHYRGHTGERPFECEFCHVTFTRKHDLKRHVKLHQGYKPYSCVVCLKSFARSDALKRHLRNAETGKESACLLRMKLDQLMNVQDGRNLDDFMINEQEGLSGQSEMFS